MKYAIDSPLRMTSFWWPLTFLPVQGFPLLEICMILTEHICSPQIMVFFKKFHEISCSTIVKMKFTFFWHNSGKAVRLSRLGKLIYDFSYQDWCLSFLCIILWQNNEHCSLQRLDRICPEMFVIRCSYVNASESKGVFLFSSISPKQLLI